MSFFPTPPLYAGIDARERSIHTAYLRKSRKGWEVLHLKTYASTEIVKPLDTSVVVSAIPGRETLVRGCEIQVKKEKDIKAALKFQIEPQLPYPAEKAIIQSQTIEKRGNGTVLAVFAVRKDHLQKHLANLKESGLEAERVTSTPYALAALTTLFPETSSPQFLVHEGDEEVTCVLVEKGKLLAARAFETTLDVGTEVQKTALSFSSTYKSKIFDSILLIGKQGETIQKATGKTVVIPKVTTLLLSQEELMRYGLAIGIALAAEGIDFRQNEFAYPYKWQKVKKPLIASIAFALLLIGTLVGFGMLTLKQQKKSVHEAYLSLLDREGKSEKSSPATPEDYLFSLSQLEKEVHARPDTFPLHPEVPKVRELLAWLATYEGIEVDSLHYTMVKRPDFSHKKEPYKIKVELEFSAQAGGSATRFHDALVTPNLFLDPKEEVQWIAGKGKYRTSFYLKDKTR